tara:strand:+ start:577 stop:801 length:225 start_codon:yes stop_codon:yes gene_type:complete
MPHYTSDNPAHIGTGVYLGGSLTINVIECDTDEGWLVMGKLDGNGNLFAINGVVQTEKIYGQVAVELPSNKGSE